MSPGSPRVSVGDSREPAELDAEQAKRNEEVEAKRLALAWVRSLPGSSSASP
jgi:hypothetical protein